MLSHLRERRAASPEPLARRGLLGGVGGVGGERPVLRREKTAVFDNRYPSLDLRSDKRKSLYELQEEAAARVADLRRRSYHELSNPELLHPMGQQHHGHHHHHQINPHNFQHSGKKSKEGKRQQQQQQQQQRMNLGGPLPPHLMGMHPPPWAYPPHPHHQPPPMGGPPSIHGGGGGGRHPPPPPLHHMGRFALPPMRPY